MKRPKLVPGWKRVLRKAWSVRLLGIAAVLSGMEAAIPYLDGVLELPRGVLPVLSFTITCAALAARLTAQRSMENEDD